MSQFCAACGKEIPDSVAFCIECGAPITQNAEEPVFAAAGAVKSASEPVAPPVQPTPQPAAAPVQQSAPEPAKKNNRDGVVKTGTYFGLMLLYAIPVVGWLICILMTLLPRNRNLKNFSHAVLISLIISLVLGVILYFVGRYFLNDLLMSAGYENGLSSFGGLNGLSALRDQLGQLGALKEQFGDLNNLQSILGQAKGLS